MTIFDKLKILCYDTVKTHGGAYTMISQFKSAAIEDLSKYQFGESTIEASLFKMVKGIQKELGLSKSELANILQRSVSTIGTWDSAESITVQKSKPSPNDQVIIAFIDIFDLSSNLFYREDQKLKWFKSPNKAFGGLSPLDEMKVSADRLFKVRDYLEYLGNP